MGTDQTKGNLGGNTVNCEVFGEMAESYILYVWNGGIKKMAITRTDVQGALKLLNSNNISNRRKHLENMFKAEHPEKLVKKILSDLESYPEWGQRMDLETPVAPAAAAKKGK